MNKIIPALLIFLAACSASRPSESISDSVVSTTPTIAATTNPTIETVSPTPTAEFPAALIQSDILLAESNNPACNLPCWQGLHIGNSNRSDVEQRFLNKFSVDIFDSSLDPVLAESLVLNIPKTEAAGFQWIGQGIGLFFLFDSSDILRGIQISAVPAHSGYRGVTSRPQSQIKVLGQPTAIFVTVVGKDVLLYMVYEDLGIVSRSITVNEIKQDPASGDIFADWCLNSNSFSVTDYILEPLDQAENSEIGSVLWDKWIDDHLEGDEPVESMLGVSVEEFTHIALSEEYPCIRIQYPSQE